MTKETNIALDGHSRPRTVAESRACYLASQWYKDPSGMLVIRWIVEKVSDERRAPAALAA